MTIVQTATGFAVQLHGVTLTTLPTRAAAQAYIDSLEQ